jgi:hypothetical protein
MQSWHDWAVYCVGKKALPIPTQKWKYITSVGMEASEALPLLSPYALTTIVLEIPVITRLGLKDLHLIGESALNNW